MYGDRETDGNECHCIYFVLHSSTIFSFFYLRGDPYNVLILTTVLYVFTLDVRHEITQYARKGRPASYKNVITS